MAGRWGPVPCCPLSTSTLRVLKKVNYNPSDSHSAFHCIEEIETTNQYSQGVWNRLILLCIENLVILSK